MLRKTRHAAVALLALIGFAWCVVTATPLDAWWARRLAGPWFNPQGDTLIVLGGSMLDQGILGQSSYWRSVYAVLTYRQGHFRRILISGGPPNEPAAEAMKQFLVAEGVPAGIVATETASRSTRDNALAVRRLLAGDSSRKVLLTSDYHMYRASRAFAKAGVAVTPVPFPDVIKQATRWSGRWPAFLELCGETVKIGYYYVRGWI